MAAVALPGATPDVEIDMDRRAFLWGAGTALYVGGDTATTVMGLQAGHDEDNPVAASIIEGYGYGGLVATKIAVVAVAFIVYSYLESEGAEYAICIPLLLLLAGGAATFTNAALFTEGGDFAPPGEARP